MHCKRCKKNEASISVRSFRWRLCPECFLELFCRRVGHTIDKYKMFSREDRVLVAVSGGKDSLALWDLLHDLGYKTRGFHLSLGLGEHSSASRAAIEGFASARGLPVSVVDIVDVFGIAMPEVVRIARRAPCRVCGMVKRYLMNRAAGDFSCVATGHHLDDESSLLLGNVLNWQESYLTRQFPVLEDRQSLRKKVKPFAFTLEDEIVNYVRLKGIGHTHGVCPLSRGATSFFYKDVMNKIEERMPAIKLTFYKDFLRKAKAKFGNDTEGEDLAPCSECGYLTVTEVCNFCRLKAKVAQALAADAA